MDGLEEALRTGKIPYTYTYDLWSGVYFGLAVLAVVVTYALAQSLTRRAIG